MPGPSDAPEHHLQLLLFLILLYHLISCLALDALGSCLSQSKSSCGHPEQLCQIVGAIMFVSIFRQPWWATAHVPQAQRDERATHQMPVSSELQQEMRIVATTP